MQCASKQLAVVNLCKRGRRTRLLLGLSGLLVTVLAGAWMLWSDVDPLWRWVLVLPLFGSFLCVLEAWTSTCVVLAALGAWDLGCGTQRVPDQGLETALRCRSLKLMGFSLLLSLVLTSIAVCTSCH
ncbi:MAG TPA: hypothetical protein VN931_00790 [Fibrobacteria bacterium]|nr:hypothetical protein [Fibrobacteria bacterium]